MIKKKQALIITLLFFASLISLQAGHIIGGEMTYTCLGNEQYRFNLRLYRDCGCTNCAALDAANIAVYLCGGNQPCDELSTNDVVQTLETSVLDLNNIPQPDASCMLTPPFVCVEEGIYEFELNLPYSDTETYHIVYQRCCRNETINNIANPEDSGATFSLVIPPAAQSGCNSSPVFNDFPPTLLCVNEFLEFEHSAFDADGDSLVYSFCSPLVGGGTGDGNGCNSPAPIPSCPPPFETVQFIEPLFTVDSPISGNPAFQIDPQSGLISGAPNLQGQFVVGVCVAEYRNGIFLGEIKRDFQFNVTACENIINAVVEADNQINYNTFALEVCGDTIVTIQNISTLEVFIEDWEWTFEWDGQVHTFEEWSPTVVFPASDRDYEGRLILNPGDPCGDTAFVQIHIFPPIEANFAYEQDSCQAVPVNFTNLSQPSSLDYFWNFGDADTAVVQHPQHLFQDPGSYFVSLIVEDTTSCRDTFIQNISWFPLPENIEIVADPALACMGQNIVFNHLTEWIDSQYEVLWDFGDGFVVEALNANHSYDNVGTYDVELTINNLFDCQTTAIFENVLTVVPDPIADFSFSPEEVSSLIPEVQFENLSENATQSQWFFGRGMTSIEPHPVFSFPDTGFFEVALVATNIAGCSDTLTQQLYVEPEIAYFLPNAFTPNADGVNDVFLGVGRFQYMKDFEMRIWNRWGEQVFYTNDSNEGWNGKRQNIGGFVSTGMYVYMVQYEDPQGKQVELKGGVSLIR